MKKHFAVLCLTIGLISGNNVLAAGLLDNLNSINNTLNSVDNTINHARNTYSNATNSFNTVQNKTAGLNSTVEVIPNTGHSKICENGKYGMKENNSGQLVVSVKYDDIQHLGAESFKILQNDKYAVYNPTLHKGSEFIYDEVEYLGPQNIVKVKQNEKYGILDSLKAKEITQCKYDSIEVLKNKQDYYKVGLNGKYGIFVMTVADSISSAGEELVEPKFNDIEYVGYKKFKVSNGVKWAAYDAATKSLITDYYNYDDLIYNGWNWQYRQNSTSEWIKMK